MSNEFHTSSNKMKSAIQRHESKVLLMLSACGAAIAVCYCAISVTRLRHNVINYELKMASEISCVRDSTREAWLHIYRLSQPFTRHKRQTGNGCFCQNNNPCPAGPPGANGKPGSDGEPGARGEPGINGARGNYPSVPIDPIKNCRICPDGPEGPPGETGSNGPMGPHGPAGPPGEEGPLGLQGRPGPPGPLGNYGSEGEPGEPGPPGRDGTLGSRGTQGPKGSAGEPGRKGRQGDPGINGVPGKIGTKGDQGPNGEPGRRGIPGEIGQQGLQGVPGNDARYCEICPPRSSENVDSTAQTEKKTPIPVTPPYVQPQTTKPPIQYRRRDVPRGINNFLDLVKARKITT